MGTFKEYLIENNEDIKKLVDEYKNLKKKDFISRKDLERMTDVSFDLKRKGINVDNYLDKDKKIITWKVGKPRSSNRGLNIRKGKIHHSHI